MNGVCAVGRGSESFVELNKTKNACLFNETKDERSTVTRKLIHSVTPKILKVKAWFIYFFCLFTNELNEEKVNA